MQETFSYMLPSCESGAWPSKKSLGGTNLPMSTKANPSPNDCYLKAEPEEPLFTLLGRDPTAPFVVIFWAKMRTLAGLSTPEHVAEAMATSEELRDWAMKLGKSDKLAAAFDAFRKACFEVAKAELEATQANPGSGI